MRRLAVASLAVLLVTLTATEAVMGCYCDHPSGIGRRHWLQIADLIALAEVVEVTPVGTERHCPLFRIRAHATRVWHGKHWVMPDLVFYFPAIDEEQAHTLGVSYLILAQEDGGVLKVPACEPQRREYYRQTQR